MSCKADVKKFLCLAFSTNRGHCALLHFCACLFATARFARGNGVGAVVIFVTL